MPRRPAFDIMRTLIALLALTGFLQVGFATAPNFSAAQPPGAQRGTEVEVRLSGDRLADAQEILFYDRGIGAEIINATNNSVTARFKIAPDCRVGEHNLRIRTAGGISPLRMFYVGTLPNLEEKEPNSDARAAQKVGLNSTVNGQIGSEDVDHFVVEAKRGQRLTVEVEGARLGRTMFDPYLAITDPQGRPVGVTDDTALLLQDAYASIIAPEDGAYQIQLRDSAYSGSGHVYRLHIGSFPRPAAAYPAGGRMGESVEVKFIGDASGDFTQQIKLPSQPEKRLGAIAEKEGFAPSPNWMRVSPFANVLEVEPNNELAAATAAPELPVAFNGILSEKGDVDHFRFKAVKGQELEIEVFGRRLGSAIDPVLQVFDAKGGRRGENDDSGNPDSYQKFTVPADGEYVVKVADHLCNGGPAYVYRVEIAEVRPQVTLFIRDTARYDYETRKSIVLPQGNRFAILMDATRANFSGELDLRFEGLPKGIKATIPKMAGNMSQIPVVFEAAADAPIDGNLLRPIAKATDPAKIVESHFRHRVEWVRIQNDTVYVKSEVDRIAAAVAEAVPFRIKVIEPKMPLVQNGALDLRVEAERDAGFDEPITLKMVFNPSGITSASEVAIPKGTNVGLYRLNASANATTNIWPLAIVASAKVKDGTAWVSSQMAKLEVAPSFVLGKIDLASTERGKPARVICKLEQKEPFDGKATVKLVGLPANTSAAEQQISKDDAQVVFEVQTSEKSQAGLHKGLFLSATFTKDGETVTQSIASGGVLRIDAPRVKPSITKTAAATPTPGAGKK
jgi:hypothetical protein